MPSHCPIDITKLHSKILVLPNSIYTWIHIYIILSGNTAAHVIVQLGHIFPRPVSRWVVSWKRCLVIECHAGQAFINQNIHLSQHFSYKRQV